MHLKEQSARGAKKSDARHRFNLFNCSRQFVRKAKQMQMKWRREKKTLRRSKKNMHNMCASYTTYCKLHMECLFDIFPEPTVWYQRQEVTLHAATWKTNYEPKWRKTHKHTGGGRGRERERISLNELKTKFRQTMKIENEEKITWETICWQVVWVCVCSMLTFFVVVVFIFVFVYSKVKEIKRYI